MKRKPSTQAAGGYPLAAVVLLVTTVAALLACIDMPKVRQGIREMDVEVSHVVGLVFFAAWGAGLGGVLGFMRPRRFAGALLGALLGALMSILLVPLTLAPANLVQCLVAMGLLVVTSIVVRASAR
jgi:hypothetical protein